MMEPPSKSLEKKVLLLIHHYLPNRRLKTRKKNDNSTSSADYEFLDESDESHFDLREDVFSREAQENNLEEGDRDYEFDTLGAVMNGTFRDL